MVALFIFLFLALIRPNILPAAAALAEADGIAKPVDIDSTIAVA